MMSRDRIRAIKEGWLPISGTTACISLALLSVGAVMFALEALEFFKG